MKPGFGLKWVLALALTSLLSNDAALAATSPASDKPKAVNPSKTLSATPSKYAGYSVDGRTSASVLAAQRSHTVPKDDETGLAVYSGLLMIGLIVFFVHALSQKK